MPNSEVALRVVVAEDHVLMRDGIVMQLESAGISVTGAYDNAPEMLEGIRRDMPDVAIVDIQMPPTKTDEGIRAAQTIRREHPGIGILVLSMFVEPAYAEAVMAIGDTGLGYLVKDRVTNLDVLIDAVQRIARGDSVVDAEIVSILLHRPMRKAAIASLTPREQSVLQLMAEGRSNSSIASELNIVERTVEANSSSIFTKLNLVNDESANRRVQAVLAWLQGHT